MAVTFDVGGTLIEPWPSVGHVYAEVAAAHGFPGLEPAALTRRFHGAWRTKGEFDYSPAAWQRLVDATFDGLVSRPPSASFFDALYRRFEKPGAWRVFEEVIPALGSLRQRGIKLGVISNWDDRLRPLLNGLDLGRWFDVIVLSAEAGTTKPAARIFHQAALALGVEPACILHVGDSPQEDVEGGRAAGFQAVRLDRAAPAALPGRLNRLTEVEAWLAMHAASIRMLNEIHPT